MSSCSASITGTNTHNCDQYGLADDKPSCYADPCCKITVYGPPENWDCLVQLCTHADITNPDMCAGCVTCPGIWTITDARTLPWVVNVSTYVRCASGGYFRCSSGKYVKII